MLKLSLLDKIILHTDTLLRGPAKQQRCSPAEQVINNTLNNTERQQSISMMRINHSGEVCAQALYQGQALMTSSAQQYKILLNSAAEENDHLHWCKQRLADLNGRTSLLNPVWYAGSFSIGVLAGLGGDKISLGFLAETEYQVARHINRHLSIMSHNDQKSRAVLEQMRSDELQHATTARQAGGVSLTWPVKAVMSFTAKILTITAAKI